MSGKGKEEKGGKQAAADIQKVGVNSDTWVVVYLYWRYHDAGLRQDQGRIAQRRCHRTAAENKANGGGWWCNPMWVCEVGWEWRKIHAFEEMSLWWMSRNRERSRLAIKRSFQALRRVWWGHRVDAWDCYSLQSRLAVTEPTPSFKSDSKTWNLVLIKRPVQSA